MKQRSILWHAAGFAAATLGGTILHFLYDWAGQNILASPFSGINESTWEHMKLLFWPLVFFAFIQRPFFKAQGNYWCVKLEEVLLGLALIPVLFYSYNGVFGKSPDWVNIAIFLSLPHWSSLSSGGHSKRASSNAIILGLPLVQFA